MKNAVLLNTPRKAKRKRKRKSSAKQRAYRALVKKTGSVTKAAAIWRKRHKAAANRTTKKKRKTVRRKAKRSTRRGKKRKSSSRNVSRNRSRNVSKNRRRPAKKRRRNTMSKNRIGSITKNMRRAGMPKSYIKRVRNGLAAANKMSMSTPWKRAYKSGVRRKKSRGRGKFSLARWKAGSLASFNPFKTRGLKKLAVQSLKIGVPVVTSGVVGYLLPFWLFQAYPQYVNKMWKRHALAAATALLAGGATLYASKKNMGLAIAAAMSAVAGYLVPTVGVALMQKLPGVVPAAPAGVSGFGLTPEIRASIERGVQTAIDEEGLGQYTEEQLVDTTTLGQSYTESQAAGAETLGTYVESEVAGAATLGGVSEFGLGSRNRF